LTFLSVIGNYFISHENVDIYTTPKRGRMVALPNNATHMRPAQI